MKDQTWLKTNLANVTVAVQSLTDLGRLSDKLIRAVAPLTESTYGAIYIREHLGEGKTLSIHASYAGMEGVDIHPSFRLGEGLVGQIAVDGKPLHLTDLFARNPT